MRFMTLVKWMKLPQINGFNELSNGQLSVHFLPIMHLDALARKMVLLIIKDLRK